MRMKASKQAEREAQRQGRLQRLLSGELGHNVRPASKLIFDEEAQTEALAIAAKSIGAKPRISA